jgi:cytochrome c oxidase assembly protein subunit 15
MGWAMVASGLRDRPEVSHYRLAAHLFLALLLYAALIWHGADRLAPVEFDPALRSVRTAKRHLKMLLIMLSATIPAGALVAGLHAGLIYNSFPMMGDEWLASDALEMTPRWLNVLANPAMVQFDHRWLAITSWLLAMSLLPVVLRRELSTELRRLIGLVPLLACLQVGLGIATLLNYVPIALAVTHQVTAFLLYGVALFALRRVSRG